MSPYFWPNSLTNKHVRINNLILMITLLVYYSHFTDEGSGPTEISTFMYCVAEFRFFCLTINYKEIKPGNPKGNQPWIFIGRTDADDEAPVLWPPEAKSWLTGKDPDAGKDWGQEEKGMTEDEMVGWYHWLNGREFEQTPGDSEEQGSLACCSPWGHRVGHDLTTEWWQRGIRRK